MASHTSTRRGILGAIAIAPVIAAASVSATPITSIRAFDIKLAAWKSAFERFSIAANGNNPDSVVNPLCHAAGAAYEAMLAEPAPDTHAVTEKLHALILWTEGCVIPEEEVWAIGADAAAVLKRAH